MDARVTQNQNPSRFAEFPGLGRVCRAGLATRGESRLKPDDILKAVEAGVNYLNWCGEGHSDGLTAAVRAMGRDRKNVFVAAQFASRTAEEAKHELETILEEIGGDYIDILTYYYVESREEWRGITGRGGAGEYLVEAKEEGLVRCIGLTSHQRRLAADFARDGHIDMLMIRYNAAHRGAERDVFPVTLELEMPVVTYTGLRWGALLERTPVDPLGLSPPSPAQCYRFVLSNPAVTVGLMAPSDSAELEEDLRVLTEWRGLSPGEYSEVATHGERVHRWGGAFP